MENFDTIHALAYYNILKTGSWIDSKIKVALKPMGLTHAQLNILHLLYDAHQPVSANDLKERILVNNPDITRLLDRLVKKGYVKRETCPVNRRKIDISITESGKEIFINAHNSAKRAMQNFFEDKISAEEAKELRRILHKIRD